MQRQVPCLLLPTLELVGITGIPIPVSTAVRATRVLLFKSCISEPHPCKVTSVLYRNILSFAQSSPRQPLCSSSHTGVTQPHCSSLPHMVSTTWLSFSTPMKNTPGKILSCIKHIQAEYISNVWHALCYLTGAPCLSSLMLHSRY